MLANVLAQALILGQADAGGHRDFPGNRPSTVLLLEELTPASLGALITLQGHRVSVSGSAWGINSFDQWSVELGKVLAQDIEPRLHSGDLSGLDGSTAGLLQRLRWLSGARQRFAAGKNRPSCASMAACFDQAKPSRAFARAAPGPQNLKRIPKPTSRCELKPLAWAAR